MAEVHFEDNTVNVIAALDNAVMAFLLEAVGELESQVKSNSRVDTYQLKNSWNHTVNAAKAEAVIGSPLENAIWEEFGTGEYALYHNGRKGGWVYTDRDGERVFTYGKTPNRTLHNARISTEPKIIQRAHEVFGRLDD